MKTCIYNVRIIIGKDEQVIPNGMIVFDEQGIRYISEHILTDIEADVYIDGTGMTALPGLIDCHVHLGMDCSPDPFRQIAMDSEARTVLLGQKQGMEFIQHGITTVRNVGTRYNADISLRNAISEGIAVGPRIYAAGQPIVMTGGHGHAFGYEVDGIDEVRKTARKQLKAGADLLKVMATGGVLTKGTEPGSPQLSEDELRCVCEEARHVQKTTAAHAIGLQGIKNAIRAGVTTIEHGSVLDDEAIQMMKENDTYLVPTLIAATLILNKGPEDGVSFDMMRKAEAFIEQHRSSFRKALQSGVKIAAGTDAGTPFNPPGLLVNELQLLIDEGMTPIQAIQAATRTGAECLSIADSTGTLEVGKWADVLLVAGNPLENILVLKNIQQVYIGGKVYVNHLHQSDFTNSLQPSL